MSSRTKAAQIKFLTRLDVILVFRGRNLPRWISEMVYTLLVSCARQVYWSK